MAKIKTEVEITEFKGHPMFTVWETTERNERKIVLNIGVKKAEALVENEDALKKFVADNKKK